MIQPLTYLLPILALINAHHALGSYGAKLGVIERALPLVVALFVLSSAVRDLHDYFFVWPQQDMVRFLYRADYRQAAQYLDEHPEAVDVAVGSTLMGPWDRLALTDDLERENVQARFFNPERALLLPAVSSPGGEGEAKAAIMVTAFPPLDLGLSDLVGSTPVWQRGSLVIYRAAKALPIPGVELSPAPVFDNGLALIGATWPEGEPEPGRKVTLWLTWQVAEPLALPPIPIVANPPPPGVYNGPRLAVFTHILDADGDFVAGDDGLWVDPVTLLPGDRFIQAHHLRLPTEAAAGSFTLEVGLYDPLTAKRWSVLDTDGRPTADRLLIPIEDRP